MKLINLLLTFMLLILVSCGNEAEQDSGLYVNHQKVDNEFTLTMPDDGVYGLNQNIDLILTHPAKLVVTGTPYINITVGEDVYAASYISGTNSETLTFRYTIQAADQDIDGIEVDTAINLNGGSIQFASSGVLQAAPTTFSVNESEVRVDTSTPTIIANTTPSPGTYVAGDNLIFVMTYDTQMIVSGSPRLELNIGGVSRFADYFGGSGTSILFFKYTVQTTDLDNDGIAQNSPLQLNGGTIKDVANNVADLTFVASDTSGVLINGAAPYITAFTKPNNATYFNGNAINMSVTFNEAVTVAGGTPSIDLTIGATTRAASYVSGSGSSTLNFQYIVQSPDLDTNGILINNFIDLNGATIEDAGNDAAVLDMSVPLTPYVKVYGLIPSIVSVSAPANNDYITGSTLDFEVQFTEDVLVSGNPRLILNIGGVTPKYASYLSGSGSDKLIFRYTVVGGDNDNDGIAFSSTAVDLNSGTINSEYSTAGATLSFAGLVPNMSGVTVNQTPATQLVITQQPSDVYVDTNISPAMTVELRDSSNNVVTSANGNVTVSILNDVGAGGTTLGGTLTVAAVNGVATFSDIQLNKSGSGFTLAFASSGLTGATSDPFNVIAANATKLAFSVQPSNTVAGQNITSAIQVQILDASNNLVTSATNNITLSFGSDPSGGAATLSGTLTVAASGGIATFSDININKAFAGYTLSATSAGLTSATSTGFNITPATKAKLAFSVEPSNTEQNASISPAIVVQIQDTYGNKTSDTDSITLAFNNNAGGGTLSGTLTQAASAGEATFNDISINNIATGYTLDATATGLTLATSAAFDITSTPTKLAITQQPTTTNANWTISPAITVEIQNSSSQVVTSATDSVTVSIATGGGILSGTTTVAAVNGVATFSDLSIDTVGTGYTLLFTATGLTSDTSSSFNITQATATKLGFSVEPSNAQAGQANSPAIKIQVQDAQGFIVSSATDNITLAFGTDPSGTTATLGGTLTVAAVAGEATFSDITIDKAFNGYTLNATAAGLTLATSAAFNITPYTPVKLGFKVQPTDTTDSASISPAIEVSVLDTYDNIVSSSSTSITLAFGNDPSSGAATLGGTLTQAASSGVATFNNITVDTSGTGYTLTANGGGYTAATSSAFTIYGTPAKLGFQTHPADTALGNNIPNIVVNILDSADNIVGNATNSVTISLSNDPSSGGATLSGTLSVAAVTG